MKILSEKHETKTFHSRSTVSLHLTTPFIHILKPTPRKTLSSFSFAMEFTESYKQSGPSSFSPNARFLAVAVDYRLVIRDTISFKVLSSSLLFTSTRIITRVDQFLCGVCKCAVFWDTFRWPSYWLHLWSGPDVINTYLNSHMEINAA